MTPVTRKFWSSRRVGGEAAAPQAVAQDHFALAAGLVFALLKAAAQRRLDTERGEEIGAHQRLYDPLGFAARAHDVGHAAAPRGEVVERRGLTADVVEIGRAAAVPLVGVLGNALEDHHEAFQVRQCDGLP